MVLRAEFQRGVAVPTFRQRGRAFLELVAFGVLAADGQHIGVGHFFFGDGPHPGGQRPHRDVVVAALGEAEGQAGGGGTVQGEGVGVQFILQIAFQRFQPVQAGPAEKRQLRLGQVHPGDALGAQVGFHRAHHRKGPAGAEGVLVAHGAHPAALAQVKGGGQACPRSGRQGRPALVEIIQFTVGFRHRLNGGQRGGLRGGFRRRNRRGPQQQGQRQQQRQQTGGFLGTIHGRFPPYFPHYTTRYGTKQVQNRSVS